MNNSEWIGRSVEGYEVIEHLGSGAIGKVFLAERNDELRAKRAIKFIPKKSLRPTWAAEINKVELLENAAVVPYITSGEIENSGTTYTWIAWKYINGSSLKSLIESQKLTLPILFDVVRVSLRVLFSCKYHGIQHGDLHSGNIMVEKPNEANIDQNSQKIWITDFGYLSVSQGQDMLDDLVGLSLILQEGLESLDFDSLPTQEKWIYEHLQSVYSRYLVDTDPSENPTQRDPKLLLESFESIVSSPPLVDVEGQRFIEDYLVAEGLGARYDEWARLFVPRIIGHNQLFARNVCVLTGLRGCGKTMVFKRLSWKFTQNLGSVDVQGSDSFYGFYLNARILADAFAWLPDEQEENARKQITHYFNCAWSIEILESILLYCDTNKSQIEFSFIQVFFQQYFKESIIITNTGEPTSSRNTLIHLISFLHKQLAISRLGAGYDRTLVWPLQHIEFLENFVSEICKKLTWLSDKSFFLFLDDYSAPMIPPVVQKILNAIVFRRSSIVHFKVATESIESIELIGLNGKLLQQEDDFDLIDYSFILLQSSRKKTRSMIEEILEPRIMRDVRLAEDHTNLESIFGSFKYFSTDLAQAIRAKEQTLYYGKEMFCDLWSSNVRDMIVLLASAVHQGTNDLKPDAVLPKPLISNTDQDKLFRGHGGKFFNSLGAAIDPTKKMFELQGGDASFGDHMQKITNAFQEIASYELLTKNSKNQDTNPPKVARRIEITDVSEELPEKVMPYYKALVRYGIFMSDWRGKSARGKAVPRLVLRGTLIPYFTLTFSRRDSLTMEWEEFIDFLENPVQFVDYWIKKDQKKSKNENHPQPDMLND